MASPVHWKGGMNTCLRSPIGTVFVRVVSLGALALVAVGPTAPASAAPPVDRVLAIDEYGTDKGRALGRRYAPLLSELNAQLYHCMPWLEVKKNGIGFFKPKHLEGDARYLSLNVYIDQDASPQFASLPREDRAARMFSRYLGPLLRRMVRDRALLRDPAVDGFAVILAWLKREPAPGERPVHETIAVFIPRSAAADYLSGRTPIGNLPDFARVLAWDGATAVGALRLTAWEDPFVSTYKLANYQLEPGVTCG